MKARYVTVMVIAVLLVAACDGGKERREAQTTIRFAAYDWTVTEIYDELRVAFEGENPDLLAEFVSLEETLGLDPRGTTPIPENAAQRLAGPLLNESTEPPMPRFDHLSAQPEIVWGLPARRSVAESGAYRQQVGAERADAYLASVAAAGRPSACQTFSSEEWLLPALFWCSRAYSQALSGEATTEEALAAAQGLADAYRAYVVVGDHQVRRAWQACARQTDPTLPGFLTGVGGE